VTGLLALEMAFTASLISMYFHGLSIHLLRIHDVRSRNHDRIRGHKFAGIESLDEFPRLKAWFDRIETRPAVQAGVAVPKIQ
jgi:glutathione S-transferase